MKNSVIINGKRYDLRGMELLDYSEPQDHGVSVERVWYGPRSHRLIVHSYSCWQDQMSGRVVGDLYAVYEPGTEGYASWVERLERGGVNLPDAPIPVVTEDD